jgi:hypothetical protein
MECVTHFGSTGCLVAKSLSVFGSAKAPLGSLPQDNISQDSIPLPML